MIKALTWPSKITRTQMNTKASTIRSCHNRKRASKCHPMMMDFRCHFLLWRSTTRLSLKSMSKSGKPKNYSRRRSTRTRTCAIASKSTKRSIVDSSKTRPSFTRSYLNKSRLSLIWRIWTLKCRREIVILVTNSLTSVVAHSLAVEAPSLLMRLLTNKTRILRRWSSSSRSKMTISES